MPADSLSRAIVAVGWGQTVVVRGRVGGEDEGELVAAASTIGLSQMVFLMRHGSGLVYAPMTARRADLLDLPVMVTPNPAAGAVAFTVTVDHFSTDTGVSARDRLATVRALADVRTQPSDLRRPGHILPIRAHVDGVLGRAGWPEATVGLTILARAGEVGVATELIGTDGAPLSGRRIAQFAADHDLAFLHIDDLVEALTP